VEMSCKMWRTTRASLWALAARNAYFPIFLDLNHQVNKPFFYFYLHTMWFPSDNTSCDCYSLGVFVRDQWTRGC